ncbi:MAG TPA: nucleotidyltransferase family protein [Vicinamibacterales bacterium]|nr:nucleotidyltransferase family protein [Vicinamibacterales bacterium]
MNLPVAILAGGLATRLHPATAGIPKSLVDVAGRPFAEHQIDLLRRQGYRDITFLVGHLGEMVRDSLGDGSRWGVRLRYVFDGATLLGTGGAILRALPQVGDPCLVLYGDSYLECDYAAIEQAFLKSGRDALMTVCRNDDRWDRSNVLFEDGRMVSYDKASPASGAHHIDYGLGALRGAAFEGYGPDESFDLAAVYQRLLAAGRLAAYEVPGRFYEIGSPEGLAETRTHLAERRIAIR